MNCQIRQLALQIDINPIITFLPCERNLYKDICAYYLSINQPIHMHKRRGCTAVHVKKPNEIEIYRIIAVLNLTIGEGGTIGTELNWAQETRVHSSADMEVWIWLTKVGCGVIDSFFGQMTCLRS